MEGVAELAGHDDGDTGVRVPRYRCPAPTCERVIFSRDTSRLARPGASWPSSHLSAVPSTWRCPTAAW
jgi:hypothetical protein